MKPPAFPAAPSEYTQQTQNATFRVLTQYLNQLAEDTTKANQKSDMTEILQWLS